MHVSWNAPSFPGGEKEECQPPYPGGGSFFLLPSGVLEQINCIWHELGGEFQSSGEPNQVEEKKAAKERRNGRNWNEKRTQNGPAAKVDDKF